MLVYLVQHAQAKSKQVDPDRPLTRQGEKDTQYVAALASKMGVSIEQIRHSGKLRAKQTATILGDSLSPPKGVVSSSGLGPVDDVKPIAKQLDVATNPVMLVGHLPFMEHLTAQLVTGDDELPVVTFHNAAIVCLEKGEERWQLSWILTSEIARL